MESEAAILALAALAQSTRLETFRLLVRHEPDGLPAGEIARALSVPQNTMSAHLNILSRAGLVTALRQSRLIVYRADLEGLRAMTLFLLKDCCGGNAELCAPLIAELTPLLPAIKGVAMTAPIDIVIYYNPDCGTSRNTLALIRHAGIEPHVIEYLKTPPSRALLERLIARMGMSVRELLREKGTPYDSLVLSDPSLTDEHLLDAMMNFPVLINRPIVVSPLGVRLCRPSERVLDILPQATLDTFTKEDGEVVIDAAGPRSI